MEMPHSRCLTATAVGESTSKPLSEVRVLDTVDSPPCVLIRAVASQYFSMRTVVT
jgi:hypothetical protein